MAKKSKSKDASAPAGGSAMGGYPKHGDEFPEGARPEDEEELEVQGDDEEGEDEEDEEQKPLTVEQRLEAMSTELGKLREENQVLGGLVRSSRATPQPRQQQEEEEEEPDWEELVFKNPKEAMRLQEERVTKKITGQLRDQYQQDQSTQKFWGAFYKRHNDLVDDDDLVQATMNKHLGELQDLPANIAGDKLADLTRQRILAYSGGKPPSGKKARAEGGGAPGPKKPKPEPEKVVTLADVIRNRRSARANALMKKGTAA